MECILPYKKEYTYKSKYETEEENMAKTSEATLKAIKKYNQKSKFINIKYTPNAISEYERIYNYCKNNNLSLQGYIKELIKNDLDNKGIPYGDNIEE